MLARTQVPIPPRRSPRDAALIADVLTALSGRLNAAQPSDDEPSAQETSDEVQDLISAAVSEISRGSPIFPRGAIAPVLGIGVLQSLIRQRHAAAVVPAVPAGDSVDERR